MRNDASLLPKPFKYLILHFRQSTYQYCLKYSHCHLSVEHTISSSKETHPSSFDTELSSEDDSSSSSFSSLLGDNPTSDVNLIPIVTINDSEETESDIENLSEEDRNVAIFKTYKTFTTEVYSYSSEYTTLPSIERFRRSIPVSSPASEQLIILDLCQKDELICLIKLPTVDEIGWVSLTKNGNKSFSESKPIRVSGFNFDQLPFDEKIGVAFLRNQAPINCGFLLENEDLPDRLRQSLDKMPPKADVPRVSINPLTAQKQAGAHASSGAQGPSSSLLPPLADKWWTLFNNFEGPEGGEVNSIFDRRFNVEQVVAREFNKKEDRSRLKDRALKIQELTEKLKDTESSSQTIASLERSLLDAKTKLTTAENEKKAAGVKYAQLEAEHSTATAERVKLKKDLDDVVAEKKKLGQDLSEAIMQKKQLAEEKTKLDVDLDALQKEIVIQHARGFHKAIDQVKVLNPTVDVEGVGVFKKIVEGQLVDESEDDEE
ncbi:hypothetical protein SESBI_07586 [Sesbania bispinosa]|nr:hypothetical protein SESBI_07586 [Sesbania bispinosa]